ncbi:MAG: DUF4982 domain-containing protein [Clostridia bacterium]|nr:DUF4982 domain-containing protein [Clostridia bacterium]
MRKIQTIRDGWSFRDMDGNRAAVELPHTWNAKDGQDGGNDYRRGTCVYDVTFDAPAFEAGKERVYLQFDGVNASANVLLNGQPVMRHDGGYSTFRADVTELLQAKNELVVEVDNSVNGRVYPQKADFTFYGGLYRDVTLVTVANEHFDMDYYGGSGLQYTATVDGADATVQVCTYINEAAVAANATVAVTLTDADGKTIAEATGTEVSLPVPVVHLWDGLDDPYLYTLTATLLKDGTPVDEVSCACGIRYFEFSPKDGFHLNGRPYPLHGVARHQDWRDIGNAIGIEHMERDLALILEVGANTVRLAHYQHNQYFYDLCDKVGLIAWAEIPYISEHMPAGRENTFSQMKELIVQNFNHPCIVTWGISNEITISGHRYKKDMLDNHHALQKLCKEMDPTRPTSLACYAMCGPFNPVSQITDLVGWNLYLGWYVPGLFLNDLWIGFYHWVYPNRCLCFSEYGAEGMPNLHSSHPRRGDNTEEYQVKYHEYMLECFKRHPYMWANYVWNMFDFAADARDQGGEPGMNHKGLVTFDRQIKKDSFYLYKAYWSKDPFVHICSKRYVNRAESVTTVKVYSNCPTVALYANGEKVAEKTADKVFMFRVPLTGTVELKAVAGDLSDTATICRVDKPDPAYKLQKKGDGNANWM